MREGGYRVRTIETRKGARLVPVEEAGLSCQRGEPDGENAFKDI